MTVLGPLLYSVVVDPAFVPQRDGSLTRRGLRLAHKEGAVDPAGQEVFRCISKKKDVKITKLLGQKKVPGDGAVVPRVFLQGVDGGDVVGGDPPHAPQDRVGLAPFARLVVGQDSNLVIETFFYLSLRDFLN